MRISSKWGLALAGTLLATGCYGPFALTGKLHKWNGEVCGTEKGPSSGAAWGNEVVFLLCNIIPVYGVCIFIDAIVLNSIEFWTGSNPMGSVTVTKLDDTRDMRLEKMTDDQIKVEIIENDVVLGTYTIDRTDSGSVLHDLAGNEVAATSIGLDGQLELVAAR